MAIKEAKSKSGNGVAATPSAPVSTAPTGEPSAKTRGKVKGEWISWTLEKLAALQKAIVSVHALGGTLLDVLDALHKIQAKGPDGKAHPVFTESEIKLVTVQRVQQTRARLNRERKEKGLTPLPGFRGLGGGGPQAREIDFKKMDEIEFV